MNKTLLRNLPKVDNILEKKGIKNLLNNYPRDYVLKAIRESLDEVRNSVINNRICEEEFKIKVLNIEDDVIERIKKKNQFKLKKVINATGTVIHTNLGRSVLTDDILDNVKEVSTGYSNLEYDLINGKRGSRYSHLIELIREITGAEDAIIVNNNAAAVLLVLSSLGKDKEVVVSRGELIEIGGAFRIPDVMEQSGCHLVEVGTTNKTHLSDYEHAITEDTGALLKVHTSNYKILGFTESVDSKDLSSLGKDNSIPVIEDLGSGVLVDLSKYNLSYEPTVGETLKKGVDIVTFSGDKLLGGPQAGIIVGKKEYIDLCKRNPLNRALRIDKFTIAALESVLRYYIDEKDAVKNIPTLRMITMKKEEIENKAKLLKDKIDELSLNKEIKIDMVDLVSQVGGGSMPLEELPSKGISLHLENYSANKMEEFFRNYKIPIIARISDNVIYFDLRTVEIEEIEIIVDAIASFIKSNKGC